MNYYSEHPRQMASASVRELIAKELAMQGVISATYRKQGCYLSGAYIVAMQMGEGSVC